tara:strand:- start:1432 stop:1713 length:282 start_codon:yes stop_codon:yes gene_type:complete
MPRKKSDPTAISENQPKVEAPPAAAKRGRPPAGFKMTVHTQAGPVELTFETESSRLKSRSKIISRIPRGQGVEGVVAKEGTFDFLPTMYISMK